MTKQEKIVKQISKNYSKIEELAKAIRKIGITAKINWTAEWYCIDDKIHCGIELTLGYGDEDDYNFIFTPDGELIHSCLEAPIKEKKNHVISS